VTTAAFYGRKSNDESDKAAEAKSIEVQRDLAEKFATARGWTLGPVFEDDGITGATYDRPGLQALLAALTSKPAPFTKLIVVEQSRIGRGDAIDTLFVVRQIERAGVEIWESRGARRISLQDDASEILTYLSGWKDKSERTKTVARVKDAAAKRFASGLVVSGGCPYGYRKTERVLGSKAGMTLLIDEAKAVVVRRIFDLAAQGMGLIRIARQMKSENTPAPTSRGWSLSGVREILHREIYVGAVVYGKQVRTGPEARERVSDPSKWTRRTDESLRIISDELWTAAHARIQASAATFLRNTKGRMLGQAERTKGLYLLSNLLVCGATTPEGASRAHGGTLCGEPLIATQRGRNLRRGYVCRGHLSKGAAYCVNATSVPMDEIHAVVVKALRETFSVESFEAHLKKTAEDDAARESRQAERGALLARLPVIATEEQRVADAIAGGAEVPVLVAKLKALQTEREIAEARVSELEGIERDLKADGETVERLRVTWGSWSGALEADPVYARQILRKVLPVPVVVRPRGTRGDRSWDFVGVGAFDGVLSGAVARGETLVSTRAGMDRTQAQTPPRAYTTVASPFEIQFSGQVA